MRLVNADALVSKLEKYSDPSARFKNEYLFGKQERLEMCIKLIEDAPTVDSVPVVRCEHCRFWSKYPGSSAAPQYHECMERMTHIGNLYTTAGEYCSRGERKDGDAE